MHINLSLIRKLVVSSFVYIVLFMVSSCAVIQTAPVVLEAIPSIVDFVWYKKNADYLQSQGVIEKDIQSLEAGNLNEVINDYESIMCNGYRKPYIDAQCPESQGFDNLTEIQLKLLCDLYTRLIDTEQALVCLSQIQRRNSRIKPKELNILQAKKALVFLKAGNYQQAERLSRNINNDSGQYINALAKIYLGNKQDALVLAAKLRKSLRERQVYMAVNLYVAAEHYTEALTLAQDCYRQLSSRFGLIPHKEDCGYDRHVDSFKFDLFDDFNFGNLGFYSYAPRANIYVEFLVAKSLLEVGIGENTKSSKAFTSSKVEKAKSRFDLILGQKYIDAHREIHWMALAERGRIAMLEGEQKKAHEYFERAIDVVEEVRNPNNAAIAVMAYKSDKLEPYYYILSLLEQENNATRAIEFAERSKNLQLINLYDRSEALSNFLGKNVVKLKELKKEEQLYISGVLHKNHVLRGATRQSIKLKRTELIMLHPKLDCKLMICKPEFPILRNLADDKETIFYYYYSKNKASSEHLLNLFVVAQQMEDPLIVNIGLDANTVLHEVDCFRLLLSNPKLKGHSSCQSEYDYQGYDYAHSLFKNLIQKAEMELAKKNHMLDKVTIVATGPLRYLPFAALMDGDKFLMSKYSLSVVPNLSLRHNLQKRSVRSKEKKLLVMGIPEADSEKRAQYTLIEAQKISAEWEKIYPKKSKLLTENAASADRFMQESKKHNYIHIASHAKFNQKNPLESKLIFSPNAQGQYPTGEIKVSDLFFRQKLLNADLVVLSGCETGLVEGDTGLVNGLVGLTIGFREAGANQVVASLWSVEDESTAKLMTWFYRFLLKNNSPANALRKAQGVMSGDKKFGQPFYWAAFQHMY